MLKFALLPLLVCLLALAACNPATPTAPPPTPNIAATVAAGIAATRAAEAAMAATIEARVAATVTAARPTAIAWPTATPWPTAAPRPTEIPWPTATAAPWSPTAKPRPTRRPISTPRPTPTPRPIATPRPTPKPRTITTPRPTPTPRPTLTAAQLDSLARYAAEHAGGPGAIYLGDGNFEALVGPAAYPEYMEGYGFDLGDNNGIVPLYAIEQHRWIFESDYYRELIQKARLTNPTPLTTQGESIILRHACVNRTLQWCKHLEAYFVPNVLQSTNGQVEVEITSFPELGVAGFYTMQLLADGTLPMTEVYGGYVSGEFPTLAIQNLWGVWYDHQTHYAALTNLFADIAQVIEDETGAQVLFHNWTNGDDQYIFSNHRIELPEDFAGFKTRSRSTELSDWINHIGGEAQAMAFAEVYTALERGIIDAAVTGANPSLSQRWYEVTDYLNGPIYGFKSTTNAVNEDVWNRIPSDLQQILVEEGAKHELEALRLSAIQNSIALQRNIDAGLEFVEFGPEMRQASFEAARDSVVPYWLQRIGYPDEAQDTVAVFNDKVGPVVGLRIERDGSVVEVPITAGPHAGKTVAEVLGRR